MHKTKSSKLVLTALMAGLALGIYALESLIPPIIPIPGVKLGLANAVSLVCLYILGARETLAVISVRVVISSVLFSNPVSMLFSLCGALLSFAVMLCLKKIMDEANIWAISIFAALAHNIGQLILAVVITGELNLWYYFLVLSLSAIVSGAFTGILAGASVSKLKKIYGN